MLTPPNDRRQTVSEIIDTPAEGFPLPIVDPPTRRLRDVARALTPGGKVRAAQRAALSGALGSAARAALAVEIRTEEEWAARRNGEPVAPASERMVPVADLFDREIGAGRTILTLPNGVRPAVNHPCAVVPVFDAEIERRLHPAYVAHPVDDLRRDPFADLDTLTARVTRQVKADQEIALTNAFDAGRAYERGATLRRNIGAKSLGSRRVQAQGIAADYLRDDPERGALHAAMVLAGFLGQDPATVTP